MIENDPKKSVCRMRWTYPLVNLETREVKTCCHTQGHIVMQDEFDSIKKEVFLISHEQLNRRREMIEGIRHESCHYCWEMEDNGIASHRQGTELFVDYFNRLGRNSDFETLMQDFAADPEMLKSKNPLLIEIILGNLCDMKCIYCNNHFSSAWEHEKKRFNEPMFLKPDETVPGFKEAFWEWFKDIHRSLEYVSFIGGEPTINPDLYSWLEKIKTLYRGNNQRPRIGVISNFNTPSRFFAKFKSMIGEIAEDFRVLIVASVDTLGERAEYIRHGLKWKRFSENVRSLLSLGGKNIDFCINPTLNVMSVSTMIGLLQWCVSLQDEFRFPVGLGRSIVIDPLYYSPMILPESFGAHLFECADFVRKNKNPGFEIGHHGNWDMYADFLVEIAKAVKKGTPDTAAQVEFYRSIRFNDYKRSTSFLRVFPELSEFHDYCRNLIYDEVEDTLPF